MNAFIQTYPSVYCTTRQEWTLIALAERMRARITKTGSNDLPWKIVASTRSNGRQRWEIDVSSWRKNWQQRASLEVRGFLPREKKIGSNVFPWKFVGSLLVDNFLNNINILEFPEKANSTINVVSERWKTCHLQLLELNQIYIWSSTLIISFSN